MDQETLHYYTLKLSAFRQADRDRENVMTDLLEKYENLLRQYHQKCDDFNNERESRRMWQQKEVLARKEVIESRHARESNPFIFVAIDGDGAIFNDTFLQAGPEGGAVAAQKLYERVQQHIAKLYPDSNTQEWSIVVQIILNVEGLAKRLISCGILRSISELYAFGRTFTRTQPLFTFVDVGYGKEQADHKIREALRFMVRIGQCKHVLFGPCSDNGYLPVLEEYKRNTQVAPRLSLIASAPPEPGFSQLGFGIESYDDIFRTTPLPPPKVVSPSTAVKELATSSSPAPGGGRGASYAAIGSNGSSNTKTITIAPKRAPTQKFYLVNDYDERLDSDVPRHDPAAEKRYMDRVRKIGHNYCNRYHLKNNCPLGDSCGYEHGEPLPPAELLVLRYKSRSLKCNMTTYCEDVDCPFSHHCRMGNKCTLDNCRYADTHHVDLRPVARVFADGTRVPLPIK